MTRNLLETLLGAVVLIVAIGFLAFAYRCSQVSEPDGYELLARFDRVDGLEPGADVRISGIKVGTVVAQTLDPETLSGRGPLHAARRRPAAARQLGGRGQQRAARRQVPGAGAGRRRRDARAGRRGDPDPVRDQPRGSDRPHDLRHRAARTGRAPQAREPAAGGAGRGARRWRRAAAWARRGR